MALTSRARGPHRGWTVSGAWPGSPCAPPQYRSRSGRAGPAAPLLLSPAWLSSRRRTPRPVQARHHGRSADGDNGHTLW